MKVSRFWRGRLKLNKWVRQTHRWLSIAFTVTVIVNFVVRIKGEPPLWVTYSPLVPLFLLLFSGLYLFVLPYVIKRGRVELSRELDRVGAEE